MKKKQDKTMRNIKVPKKEAVELCDRCGKKIFLSKMFKHQWKYCKFRLKDIYPERYDQLREDGKL